MVVGRCACIFVVRLVLGSGGLCGVLVAVACSAEPLPTGNGAAESTLGKLEFRIADAEPNAAPVRSFRYSYVIATASENKPLDRRKIAYRSEDGILRISPPFPPFGRIRVWVEADDGRERYRAGYDSFSYRLAAQDAAPTPTITLRRGIVVTGKVLDAETGKAIAGAEVAPTKWGHHFNWADWDEVVKTDRRRRPPTGDPLRARRRFAR